MNLRDRVELERQELDFNDPGPGPAKNLYLGRAEFDELRAYAETPDFVMGVAGQKSTFCGLTIYVVFDESHFAVG